MAKINVDFSEVQSFEPLPEGFYRCRVEEVTVKDNNAGDGQYLNWMLEVVEEGEYQGRKLWFITSLKHKALWKLKETFENLGIEGEAMDLETDDDTGLVVSPELVDLVCTAEVENEVYQGKVKNRVQNLLPAEKGGAAPSAESKKDKGKGRKLK